MKHKIYDSTLNKTNNLDKKTTELIINNVGCDIVNLPANLKKIYITNGLYKQSLTNKFEKNFIKYKLRVPYGCDLYEIREIDGLNCGFDLVKNFNGFCQVVYEDYVIYARNYNVMRIMTDIWDD